MLLLPLENELLRKRETNNWFVGQAQLKVPSLRIEEKNRRCSVSYLNDNNREEDNENVRCKLVVVE